MIYHDHFMIYHDCPDLVESYHIISYPIISPFFCHALIQTFNQLLLVGVPICLLLSVPVISLFYCSNQVAFFFSMVFVCFSYPISQSASLKPNREVFSFLANLQLKSGRSGSDSDQSLPHLTMFKGFDRQMSHMSQE